ncbi:MAG: hypothetical protein DYG89_52685 [Caldilinea sp. CFX5]|nr:hypothetical protein [Caldilinea sp. CFX5]
MNYEVADRDSELSGTWREYIDKTVDRINDQYGKRLLLHLSKYNDRYWTPRELKDALQLEEDEKTIHRKLLSMHKGDLIEWGSSDIRFRGLQDGTLNLILRHRFEEEIADHQTPPDLRIGFREEIAALRRENRILQGKLNHVTGVMAEYQLATAMRSRKRFPLRACFSGATADTELNVVNVRTRVTLQRDDGKGGELDVVAEASDQRVLLVEVRKRQVKANGKDIQDFGEKVVIYQSLHPEQQVLAAFLSLGGFTEEALAFCQAQRIAWSSELVYF